MPERRSEIHRVTRETDVRVTLDLDGGGRGPQRRARLPRPPPRAARPARPASAWRSPPTGDLHIDVHHLAEDVGITLGQAWRSAVGDAVGIERYADAFVPMDETLAHVVVDLSGRPFLAFDPAAVPGDVGGFTTYHLREFLRGFANHARATIHVRWLATGDPHHGCEAVMKAFARALHAATRVTGDALPSTKGTL
jgi:imidazoleglycerol-phosphate dehydratase